MIFDGKPTREISAADLLRLVAERVPEDRHLDYKQAPYPSTDPGKKELIKDVCSFANTDGGYIIIGIRDDGERRAADFINVENVEGVRHSIIDSCLEKIEPRLELDVGNIEVDGNNVVIVRVPESDRKPHCAKPDAEHHYFWRRYEDGNKIMSPAEIRECFEGDRTNRALAEIVRELESLRREHVATREASIEIGENNLLQVTTLELFLDHLENRFLAAIGRIPFFRLTATPLPLRTLDMHLEVERLSQLIMCPPVLRQDGWGLRPHAEPRRTGLGLECGANDSRFLRILWNGHLEFWNPLTGHDFMGVGSRREGRPLLYPYAFVEPAANFVLLVKAVCDVAKHVGDVRFRLGFYNLRGWGLGPGNPDSYAYRRSLAFTGGPFEVHLFNGDHLSTEEVHAEVADLPGDVAWRLVSQVYLRFDHPAEAVPFFDAEHHCTLGGKG